MEIDFLKCNELLRTTFKIPNSKQVVNKILVDDVLKYMIQFKGVCTCDIECNTNPCGVCVQGGYCGNCNCKGACECNCQCQCECNEISNGNTIVCPCNCEVLSNNCTFPCECNCVCNCDCPCPCPCDCDCPCVGPSCDKRGSPKTDCEKNSDGKKVSYCNSATTLPDGTRVPAQCGTTNCANAHNPVGANNSGGSTSTGSNCNLLQNLGLQKKSSTDCTYTGAANCWNCACTTNCGTSNCGTACDGGVCNQCGAVRNCLSFCDNPTINCDLG